MRDRFSIPLAFLGLYIMVMGVAVFGFYFGNLPIGIAILSTKGIINWMGSLLGIGIMFFGMYLMFPLFAGNDKTYEQS